MAEQKFSFGDDVRFIIDQVAKNVARWNNIMDILEGEYANKKGITPYEVIYKKNRFRILHYLSDHPKRFKIPIVFVYALINRYYILDLSDKRSFVQYLLEKGFDVYMVDWGYPSKVEGKNTIADYIEHYLDRGIDKIREFSGQDKVTLFGYCLGAMMSIIYTAAYPEKIQNLPLLTPPVDFSDEGVLTSMTNPKYFDVDRIVDYFDHLVPSEFIQSGFDLKNALGTLMMPFSFWEILWNKKALSNFFPMNHWVHDNIPIASEFWKEYVEKFYIGNSFMKNNFSLRGRKLNFKDIKCPVLAVAADKDDIVTPKCAEGIMQIVGSKDKTMMKKRGGHVGVVAGATAANELWPDIFTWLSKRNERIVEEKEGVVTIK